MMPCVVILVGARKPVSQETEKRSYVRIIDCGSHLCVANGKLSDLE